MPLIVVFTSNWVAEDINGFDSTLPDSRLKEIKNKSVLIKKWVAGLPSLSLHFKNANVVVN